MIALKLKVLIFNRVGQIRRYVYILLAEEWKLFCGDCVEPNRNKRGQ